LPPAQADVAWYGLRAWIEASYKDLKHDGWRWEQTTMRDPRRAERVWLMLALTTCQRPMSPARRPVASARHAA
ncbi:MAG: transposase, partial [Oscillochloris sp.]|nr:transposase [Oscillochloris sp.]